MHGHHDRLVPRLLPVGRTARSLLVLFALLASEFFSTLPSLLDVGHTFLIVHLGLFPRAQDLVFREEGVFRGGRHVVARLLFGLERSEFTFDGGTATGLHGLGGGLDPEVVEQREVGRGQDLQRKRIVINSLDFSKLS